MNTREQLADLAGRLDPAVSFDMEAFLESLTTPQLEAMLARGHALGAADQARVVVLREPDAWRIMLDDRVLLDSAEEL